jgi:toxin ParE1/3/4
MLMRHKLSARAVQDVARLYRQSILGFGRRHADTYLQHLESTFAKIADAPRAVPLREEYRGDVRVRRFEAHHILYRTERDHVLIVRVLHGRQDISKYL